jgi:hypothetical protein
MAAVVLVAGAMVACAEIRVPTVDSETWAYGVSAFGSVHWVDDSRVLFLGSVEGDSKHPRHSDRVLKLFDVSTGSVRVVERNVSGFCYADGRLLLIRTEGRRVDWETRTLEEPAPEGRVELSGSVVRDPLNCRVAPEASAPGRKQGRRWKPLRDGDGVLDYGERGSLPALANLQHRNADGSGAMSLDVPSNSFRVLTYVPFEQAYLLYNMAGGLALDEEHAIHPVHWFAPGEPVRHVDIRFPSFLLKGSGNRVFPTRAGFLILYQGGAATGGCSSTQGLHLAVARDEPKDQRTGRVLAGYVGALAVSPDGCRVAAVHAESIRAKRKFRSTLKVLDLCAP